MSADEIDFQSIQNIFSQRDTRLAEEARKQLLERSTSADASSKRVSGARRAASSAHRGVSKPSRTHLERTPVADEFLTDGTRNHESPRSRSGSSGRTASGSSSYTRRAQTSKKGGTRLESAKTSETAEVQRRKPAQKDGGSTSVSNPAKALVILGEVGAGLGALLKLINIFSPAAPVPDAAIIGQGIDSASASNSAYVATYESEDNNVFDVDGTSYTVEFNDSETGAVEVTVAPVETPAVPVEHVTDDMLEALKGWESFKPDAYYCPSGVLTIGWGHTNGVYKGQTVTKEEATVFLREDIQYFENVVKNYAEELGVTLTQGQLDAFTSFAFNCGASGFRNSGLTEILATGDIDGTADLMKQFVKGTVNGEKVTMPGLVTRREVESGWLYA